jgi:hypothetical protein
LRRVVDFEAVALKVPQVVSGTQVAWTTFMVLVISWSCGHLFPNVVVALPSISCVLTWGWSSCSEFLLPMSSPVSVGILALCVLFIYLSILGWYICGDDQDLTI